MAQDTIEVLKVLFPKKALMKGIIIKIEKEILEEF